MSLQQRVWGVLWMRNPQHVKSPPLLHVSGRLNNVFLCSAHMRHVTLLAAFMGDLEVVCSHSARKTHQRFFSWSWGARFQAAIQSR